MWRQCENEAREENITKEKQRRSGVASSARSFGCGVAAGAGATCGAAGVGLAETSAGLNLVTRKLS